LQCVAVCCSVLQCVAVCCSVLQCDMRYIQCIPTHTSRVHSCTLDLESRVEQNTAEKGRIRAKKNKDLRNARHSGIHVPSISRVESYKTQRKKKTRAQKNKDLRNAHYSSICTPSISRVESNKTRREKENKSQKKQRPAQRTPF